ncbi:MAG: hypothetical protein ACOYJ2_05700 [Rickettsiales bacterium]
MSRGRYSIPREKGWEKDIWQERLRTGLQIGNVKEGSHIHSELLRRIEELSKRTKPAKKEPPDQGTLL